jgi:hypothetical protein
MCVSGNAGDAGSLIGIGIYENGKGKDVVDWKRGAAFKKARVGSQISQPCRRQWVRTY